MTRKEFILHVLRDKHRVGIEELADSLKVSCITIRRDLKQLEDEGLVSRIHGGASLPFGDGTDYKRLSAKETLNISEKNKIARKIKKLIRNDSIVFINGGSTTVSCLQSIESSHIDVFTNNAVATTVAHNEGVIVHYTGGILDMYSKSFYGNVAHNSLLNIKADFCILGANGISLEDGVTSFSFNEHSINQIMVKNTIGKVIVVIDHSKINVISNCKVCDIDEIDILVTGKEANHDFIKKIEELGVRTYLV